MFADVAEGVLECRRTFECLELGLHKRRQDGC